MSRLAESHKSLLAQSDVKSLTIMELEKRCAQSDEQNRKLVRENEILAAKIETFRMSGHGSGGAAKGSSVVGASPKEVSDLKETLYCDLSGLIIRNVRSEDD